MASVNITKQDRDSIARELHKRLSYMAKAKTEKLETFHKDITKTIINRAMEDMVGLIEDNPLTQFLPSAHSKGQFLNDLSYLSMPEEYKIILTSDSGGYGSNKLMDETVRYDRLDESELVIPSELYTNDNRIVNFLNHPYVNSFLDEDIKQKIEDHNTQITEILAVLEEQLKTNTDLIKQCNTTKQFEQKIPYLTELYTNSVKKKLKEKEEAERLSRSEVDDDLAKATLASLATSRMLQAGKANKG